MYHIETSKPAGIHLFKVKKGNTRTMSEVSSKLTLKTPEQRQLRCSGVFVVNFEEILFLHLVLVFPCLTLSKYMPTGKLICSKNQWTIFAGKDNICWEYWSYNIGECSVFERIYNYKSLNVDKSLWLRGSRHF